MNKNKRKIFVISLIATLLIVLTGCGIKTPLTQEKLTKEFNNNTVSLLKVKRLADSKAQAKGKKNTGAFIKKFNNDAKKEQVKVEKSLDSLEDGKKFSGYPADVQTYSKNVLNYIKSVTSDKSQKSQTKAYHKTAVAAMKIASDQTDKNTKNYVTTVVQNDSVLQAKPKVVKSKKTNKNTSSKKKTNTKKSKQSSKKSTKKVSSKGKSKSNSKDKITLDSKGNVKGLKKQNNKMHVVNISWGWGIVLILVSGLLIATVFMQPNKSEDMSKALTDEKSMPKPRGYALFVVRSTEVLTIALVVILIIMNRIK